ncbi:MAG: protoheme IX farnesyltransferase, partial [Candidatus Omnitrophica bacterium]|nr:protoheme IX farnesyltransferase [Candidatus Omnitrophota bacterium]
MSGDGSGDRGLLHGYAVLTAVATFLLLIAGGLVTSTGSGLSVPDWPLSYGGWFPPMVGGILYEHGHRMIAGLVGLMVLVLAAWLWRAEPRVWVRRLGEAALVAVILQALLGGLTVLLLLPPAISIAHAVLGQAIFCLAVCLSWCTSPRWTERPASFSDATCPSLRALGLMAACLVLAQVFLGALVRHTGRAVGAHIFGAAALLLVTGWFVMRAAALRSLRPHAWRLMGLVALQLVVGGVVFTHRASVALRTAHQALGALVLAQAILLAWQTIRYSSRSARARPWRRWIGAYAELTKARLSGLVLLTTAVGFWLGMREPAEMGRLLPLCAGMALVVGGAHALNQWLEREWDALMERTRRRPLPSGQLSPETACRFGMGMSLAGIVVLAVAVNLLSATLAAIAWALYLLVYTPLKRRTPLCTLVGAIPGALPPMIGWAGARHALGVEAWVLFALLFIWQLPHFLALAVLYREDY